MLVCGLPILAVCTILRISGNSRVAIAFVQTVSLYLSAAWLSMVGAGLLAEAIVTSERLRQRSLDSQLVGLGIPSPASRLPLGC
jgi:hypothetical protein